MFLRYITVPHTSSEGKKDGGSVSKIELCNYHRLREQWQLLKWKNSQGMWKIVNWYARQQRPSAISSWLCIQHAVFNDTSTYRCHLFDFVIFIYILIDFFI